jgi:hypothetical protein
VVSCVVGEGHELSHQFFSVDRIRTHAHEIPEQ